MTIREMVHNLSFRHEFKDPYIRVAGGLYTDDFNVIRWHNYWSGRFAFARFADGERAILEGTPLFGCDGWESPTTPEFQKALWEALTCSDEGWHLGISCRCCDAASHAFYLRHATLPQNRITFSNLFSNANRGRVETLLDSYVLVAPTQGVLCGEGNPFVEVPRNCVGDLKAVDDVVRHLCDHTHNILLNMGSAIGPTNTVILVAAGPAACVIAHRYWMSCINPLSIIDIGSALDTLIHGHPTRGYHHEDSPTASKVCVW